MTRQSPSVPPQFRPLFWREWQLKKQAFAWLAPLVLFVLILTLFPLALGAQTALLARLAVPIVWIAALLSLVIGTDGLFKPDFDNGTLVQLVAVRVPLPLFVLAKLLVHWLFGAFLVAQLAWLAVPLFGVAWQTCAVLLASIMIGSPILLALSAIATALAMATKNAAILVPLIALPLQLPVLIFATGAVERFAMGLNFLPIFALLAAGSLLAIIAAPFVVAACLRLAWES